MSGLIFYAARELNDKRLRDIAVRHCLTTRRCLVRGDGSVAHEGIFDPETGEFLRQTTQQGFRGDSCWSRGLAWALYGFAASNEYSRDPRFLKPLKLAPITTSRIRRPTVFRLGLQCSARKSRAARYLSGGDCGGGIVSLVPPGPRSDERTLLLVDCDPYPSHAVHALPVPTKIPNGKACSREASITFTRVSASTNPSCGAIISLRKRSIRPCALWSSIHSIAPPQSDSLALIRWADLRSNAAPLEVWLHLFERSGSAPG